MGSLYQELRQLLRLYKRVSFDEIVAAAEDFTFRYQGDREQSKHSGFVPCPGKDGEDF
jgi:hypothetical protein